MAMMRTPLYEEKAATEPTSGGGARGDNARDIQRDNIPTKLIKYIPGEIVAAFALLVALVPNISEDVVVKNGVVMGLFGVFLVITPIYFGIGARQLKKHDQPRWYFYLLSILAFGIWAIAMSDIVRGVFNISSGMSEFTLAIGTFFIPFIDEGLTVLQDSRAWRKVFGKTRPIARS